MPGLLHRCHARLLRFADRPGYPALVALVGATDYFVPGSPSNALFIAALAPRRRQWRRLSVCFACGCATGAFTLAALVAPFDQAFPAWIAGTEAANLWARFDALVERHGLAVLLALAITPAPVRIVVAILALSGYSAWLIGAIVLGGRLVAYPTLGWLVATSPALLLRVPVLGPWLRRLRPPRSNPQT